MALKVVSWNVNGLNGAIKRTKCLDYLRTKQASVVLIQESHLKACDVHRFQNRHYKLVYFSSSTKKTKGVLILVVRRLPFSIHCSKSDAEGRITCILGTWYNRCAFVSVYAPNEHDSEFYQQLVRMILSFSNYYLVIGSDFNAVHNPLLMESRAIHAIKNEDTLCNQSEDINLTFKTYYEQLYTSNFSSYQQHISFLQQLHLPKIDKHHQEMLNCPLSLEELKLALDSVPKKKSPGIDGIPPELISAIWDIVSPLILNSFNFAVENGALHRDQNTALITPLLKKGKDPLQIRKS
ncbi:hypothetical protein PO909_005868 [Leuciscus waleckii]